MTYRWSAIAAARQRDRGARVRFSIEDRVVGSVARLHLKALQAWPQALSIGSRGVALTVPAAERDAVLAEIDRSLHAQGLIRGWRDETYAVPDPRTLQPLARIERAASRFWGTLTFGAHCTGYVADASGRPSSLWIAQRSFTKATDPGRFDNLVGGGVPAGQSPVETLVREGWEEAGLTPEVMRGVAQGRVLALHRDIPEGLQREWIHCFDVALAPGHTPANQDGEVHSFTLMPLADALALAGGETMTVDASLVTLEFALRHHLLSAAEETMLGARAAALWVNIGA